MKVSGTKYRGLAPHRITPMLGVLHRSRGSAVFSDRASLAATAVMRVVLICSARWQQSRRKIIAIEASNGVENCNEQFQKPIAENFPEYARFVRIAARLIGDSHTLQHARAKSWIALSCIHADFACHCVSALQRNSYNAQHSTRSTDILIGQSTTDSGLTIQ